MTDKFMSYGEIVSVESFSSWKHDNISDKEMKQCFFMLAEHLGITFYRKTNHSAGYSEIELFDDKDIDDYPEEVENE